MCVARLDMGIGRRCMRPASVHANACKKGPPEGSVQAGAGFPALVWVTWLPGNCQGNSTLLTIGQVVSRVAVQILK